MMLDWEMSCGRPSMRWLEVGPAYTASLYWTFTTITTVGYGDLTPKATGERAFAIFAMCIGTGLFGYIFEPNHELLAREATPPPETCTPREPRKCAPSNTSTPPAGA